MKKKKKNIPAAAPSPEEEVVETIQAPTSAPEQFPAEAEPAAEPESSAQVETPAETEPAAEPEAPTETEAPEEAAPSSVAETSVAPAEEEEEDWEETEEDLRIRRRIRRKRIFRGALRFYTLLFGFILCVLILLVCVMNPLKTLLTQYETSQPEYVAEEIYNTLFADADWALLYDMAGIQATEFEGRREYAAFMEKKMAGNTLEYVEVPSGVSGEKRYSVRLKGEEVAAFTMTPVDDGVSTFGRWAFGRAEVFFTRQESVTVTMMPGYTVYINGVPLDDSYTVQNVSTAVEAYLPEGLHGYRYVQQRIDGLLVRPDVAVLDEYNNPVTLTRDPATGVYTTPITNTVPMTWGESELILSTVQAEALFAIRDLSVTQLRQYFSPSSQAYDAITALEPLTENVKSCAFDESATVIQDFYRYSDDLFSVWAQVKLDVTDEDGKVTSYTVGGTYFFAPNTLGVYMATEKYDANLQELVYDLPSEKDA